MYQLREIERTDLEQINKWRNDPKLISSLGAPFRYINLDVDQKWFESYMSNRGNSIRCSIVNSSNSKEIVGLVSLLSIDYINGSCEFHIMIGDSENQGKGIGTFAIKSMLNYAFNDINLRRVELSVLKNNEKALHLYEKVGFKVEGIKREAVYKNGEYVDIIIMSILKKEFNC